MSSRMNGHERTAYLGLGGNIGDVKITMAAVLQGLDAMDEIDVVAVSSLYKTPPWGMEDQPWFLNCCAEITTSLEPEALLDACQSMERAGKRERTTRWGPRTIDVDILVFEGHEQVEQRLTIPHPRILERAFVLIPLAEIAPELEFKGEKIKTLASTIPGEGIKHLYTKPDWWR